MKALALLALLAGVAHADPVPLPKSKALLDVPASWKKLEGVSGLEAAFESPRGTVLAVTRAAVPNLGAWIKESRETYSTEVEKGALAAIPNARKLARRFADINGVPTLDLEVRRPDGSTLVMRWLLFRSYALAAALEVPKGGSLDEARTVAAKFTAPKPGA